tara:strand:+ start:867 stop:1802 length:936 start_codon:yes stop_codon:yes gene_type:complete
MTFNKVLVLGDTIIDVNTYTSKLGISSETPTLVGRYDNSGYSFGGAALVYRNLTELNSNCSFITAIGNDEEGLKLKDYLNINKCQFIHSKKESIVKHRFWIDDYKVFQFDKVDNTEISESSSDEVLSKLRKIIPNHDCIILSDYRHGFFSKYLISQIIPTIRKCNSEIPIYLDSQVSQRPPNHHKYAGVDKMFLNKNEQDLLIKKLEIKEAWEIVNKLDLRSIILKDGANEAKEISHKEEINSIPPKNIKVVDTCGAGDSFIASYSALNGANQEKLDFATQWSAANVGIKGPNPCTLEYYNKVYGIRNSKR